MPKTQQQHLGSDKNAALSDYVNTLHVNKLGSRAKHLLILSSKPAAMLSSSRRCPTLQLPLTTHDVVVACQRCLRNRRLRTCRRWVCKIRLSITGYKNIANQFLDKIELLHSAKQMKNKFDNLKKDWVAWKKLENASHVFRTKPLEHLDLIERVYSGQAATGKHAWTPTEVRHDAAVAANANEDSGMGSLSAGTPPQPGHDTVGENTVDSSFFDDAPPQLAADRSTNAKCRKRPTLGTIASSMDNLVEAVSKQSRELKITQYVVTGKCDNIVGDCLARLMSTPRLEPSDKLFLFTCSIMNSPDNRDIIMALPVDYIVNWLTKKCACTPANVGRDHERGIELFRSDGVVNLD
ncbi:unnamed protein product [Camellia sinensis]